jgi:ankyrin repeat protein
LLQYDIKLTGISLINFKDKKGNYPLYYAIRHKNLYAVQELLSYGADVNLRNRNNHIALHIAVISQDISIFKMILKNTRNINVRSNTGATALLYACNFELRNMVELLMERGANQYINEHEYELYPIFYAVIQNNIAICEILISTLTNPNLQDFSGNTIVHYALSTNHQQILQLLFNKYDIHKSDNKIYIEDTTGKLNNVIKSIDPTITNSDGLTIGHLMLYNWDDSFMPYMTKIITNADLNYQDNQGNTLLHLIAIQNFWKNFYDILIKRKLNIYITNGRGQTVLDLVYLQNQSYVLDLIAMSWYNYMIKHANETDKADDATLFNDICSIDTKDKDKDKEACLQIIKRKIIDDKISVPINRTRYPITIQNNKIVNFSTFTGSLLDLIVGFKWLVKRHPDANSLFHSDRLGSMEFETYAKSIGIRENPHQHIINFEIRWIYQKLFLIPNFDDLIQSIVKSKKYKFIVIPLGIILSNGNHTNGIYINLEKNLIERFEPHGSSYPTQFNYNPDLLDEVLSKKLFDVFKRIYPDTQFNYIAPKYYLPKVGFQYFDALEVNVNKNIGDPSGFCTLWTLWYFDYRLQYHMYDAYKIVKHLIYQIRSQHISFRTLIRNYSEHITSLRDTYLSKTGFGINDYLNNRLTDADLKNLLITIISS